MRRDLIKYVKRGLRQGSWPLLQRYAVAPAITKLPPVEVSSDSEICVHVYLCEPHAIMLHWALRSLLNVCRVPFQVMIHDDGSCTDKTLALLAEKFVGIKIIKRDEAARRMLPLLADYPLLKEWWPTNARSINVKWLDAYLLGDSRYIVFLDSDILFFEEPRELFQLSPTTVWMHDSSYMLEIPPEESVKLFGGYPLPPINAGLGRIERSRFNLGLAEKVLKHLGTPRDDMTMHAVITAQYPDFELLPPSYDCTIHLGTPGKIAKHYTSPFRFWFYEEGIPKVAKQLELPLSRWLSDRP